MNKTTFDLEDIADRAEKIASIANIIDIAVNSEDGTPNHRILGGAIGFLADALEQHSNELYILSEATYAENRARDMKEAESEAINTAFAYCVDKIASVSNIINNNAPAQTDQS